MEPPVKATSRPKLLFPLLVTIAPLVSGCGDGATSPEPDPIVPERLEAVAVPALAVVGATVTPSPTVTLRDTKGRPLAGATVSFEVTAGGGSVERMTSVTGLDGTAGAGAWVLGTRPGTNTLEARSAGVAPVAFAVVTGVGPPATLSSAATGAARGVAGQALDPAPAVVVRDAFGNPVAGVTVAFAPVAGGGQVAQPAAVTDTSGVARVGWTLGPAAGAQSLQAVLGELAVTIGADAAPGAPAALQVIAGDGQQGTVGQPLAVPPAVRVKDTFGNPVAGAAVQFAVSEGSGQVAGATVVSDSAGTARVSAWTLGTRPGANRLTASTAGTPPVVFSATAGPGPVASLVRLAGDGQTATAGTLVLVAPAVTVSDSYGNPVPNAEVTFTAVAGTVTAGLAHSDSTGVARAGGWRLGNAAGPQTLEARTGSLTVSFSATAAPGPPSVLELVAGQDQSAVAGTAVPIRPAVRVRDAVGNVLSGVEVRFTATAGGGSVSGGTALTGSGGVATVGGWTLGQVAGSNTLTATVTGAGSLIFNAAGVAGPAANVVKAAGDGQRVTVGTAVPIRPKVRVTDTFGNPVQNVAVNFSASPGSSSTGNAQVTGTDGTASVGQWVLAAAPGTNTLTAAAPGAGTVTFTATGVTSAPPPGPFRIEVRYLTDVTEVQREAFEAAVDRWQEVITGDLPNGLLNISAGQCGSNSPALNEVIDDLLIFVTLEAIDGPGSTLGSAGPCDIRGGSSLPLLGRMRFDTADLEMLAQSGRLTDVILHELGHVLGIGTIWDLTGTLQGEGTADPFFSGQGARQRFILAGGTSPAGYGVPVENTGGAGTRDSHWRESALRTELMTGWVSAAGTANPLSAITIASLADLGYLVDLSRADPYTVPSGAGYQLDTHLIWLIEEPLPPPRVAR
jgi:adhesin/invasin